MIKALLFDLDGTLIDTNTLILDSFKHAFKKHLNIIPPESEIVKLFGEPLERSLAKYVHSKSERMELITSYRNYNDTNHDSVAKPFDGVKDALIELRKEFKIAVVTSKRSIMAHRGLELFQIKEYFDAIITPEDTKEHKPNPDPALCACKALGVNPEEAIMVGDSHNDILCGKNAGTKTCLVTYTALDLEELKLLKPDFIVDNIIELSEVNKEEAV